MATRTRHGETRSEMNARIHREGRFAEYSARRAALKAAGYPTAQVYERLADEFAPLGANRPPGAPPYALAPVHPLPGAGSSQAKGSSAAPRLHLKDFAERNKSASETDVIRWVFNHMDVADVTPADAPSSGAWTLLCAVRDDVHFRHVFFQSMWVKTLPARSELDTRRRREDDGRDVLRTIGLCQRASSFAQTGRGSYVEARARERERVG